MNTIPYLLTTVLTLLVLRLPLSSPFFQEQQESFYAQSARCVIRLEHKEEVKKEGQTNPTTQRVWDGTGFFVQTAEALYVVTASHVAKKDYDLHARVPVLLPVTGKVQVMELRLPRERWVHHPQVGSASTRGVDVAVMRIPQLPIGQLVVLQYCPQNCPEKAFNQLDKDPEPPLQVMVFGFPLDIGLQLKEPRPMGRQGIVALRADEEFIQVEGKFAERRAFLVDAKIFPGNSGSPIVAIPPLSDRVHLVGLVIAANPNLDFAVAEPVSRIRETVDRAKNEPADFEAWYRF